ncbi:hypothetical protein [Legionella taurinensis]|uniref:Uncharacterized protein n=1 Tax=Legionella taurinensis TaxID=70611 RepID=A0A3A5L1B7_9GAMM|nr:hypothetical protein [Legionella taurinensis]RJT44150.1 hypothetical protein D6J04_12920 [Legionella taurinensis]RJT64920.1 hypothetical protein D6J03_13880 [Legionella taurinensis]STY26571.1 Uncharacterised protein [Legionella taurinensis]
MEPVTIAIICAAVFGVVGILAAFIRQLLISRDKNLNDQAQLRALAQEAAELNKLRQQMASNKRFDSHYQALGSNKEAIQYLDQKIEEILKKKEELIHRYAEVAIRESETIISGEQAPGRKEACDKLKREIDKEIEFYDNELALLQKRRAALWDSHSELQDYLLDQEGRRNRHLDTIYQRHTGLLEKIYLRHNYNSEHVARDSLKSTTSTFKSALMLPLEFLLGFFRISSGIDPEQAKKEAQQREDVAEAETDINESDENTKEDTSDNSADDASTDEKTPLRKHPKKVEFAIN